MISVVLIIIRVTEYHLMALVIVGIVVALIGFPVGDMLIEEKTMYQYEVKAEQVEDARMFDMNDTYSMSELSSGQEKVLFKAFKKSDHFLGGGSSSFVVSENEYNSFEGWKVVEVNGVFLLVAIQKEAFLEEKDTTYNNYVNTGIVISFVLGLITFMVSFWVFLEKTNPL